MKMAMVVDASEWQAAILRWRPGVLDNKLTSAATEAGALVKARAMATVPVGATKQLRGSHGHKVVRIGGNPTGIVSVSALHAIVIHQGRRAGKRPPPVSKRADGQIISMGPLVPWLKFKGIPLELEYVIARSIGRKGFKGRPWLFKAAEDSLSGIVAIYNRWLAAP